MSRSGKVSIGKNAPFWGLGLACLGVVGGLVNYLVQDDPEAAAAATLDLRAWSKLETETGETRITGPGQVAKEQGDMTYTFNFESGHVFVTGPNLNDSMPFAEFKNDRMIDTVKGEGCTIAGTIIRNIDAYNKGNGTPEEQSTQVADYQKLSQTYIKKLCP
jgi:hypothetical protein